MNLDMLCTDYFPTSLTPRFPGQTYIAISWNFLHNSMRTIFPKKISRQLCSPLAKTGEKFRSGGGKKIEVSSQYLAAYSCVRQLTFGNLDMAYHTITAPVDDAIAFEKAAIDKTLVLPRCRRYTHCPQFSHIFSGGYAQDTTAINGPKFLILSILSVFKANGIFDPVTATSFRDNILKRGGTENPMILYKRFKGSEPTIDALMRRDGIIH